MSRTAIRHTLSALAAVALSLALLGPAVAGDRRQTPKLHPSQLQWSATTNAAQVSKTRAEISMSYARNMR